MSLDLELFKFINSLAGQSRILDFFGIFFAEYLPYLLGLAAIVLIFYERNWRKRLYDFFLITGSTILARGLVTTVIRFFFYRERPYVAMPDSVIQLVSKAPEASFPSGHATFFFALAVAIYYARPRAFPYFLIGAALIGLARVFAGLHYPVDILAGAILGALSAYAVHHIFPELPETKSREII